MKKMTLKILLEIEVDESKSLDEVEEFVNEALSISHEAFGLSPIQINIIDKHIDAFNT